MQSETKSIESEIIPFLIECPLYDDLRYDVLTTLNTLTLILKILSIYVTIFVYWQTNHCTTCKYMLSYVIKT